MTISCVCIPIHSCPDQVKTGSQAYCGEVGGKKKRSINVMNVVRACLSYGRVQILA